MSSSDTSTSSAKPKLTVETADAAPEAGLEQASPESTQDVDFNEAVGFIKGLGIMMWKYAESHPHTVLYGFIGFVLAVLILVLGLWNTIVIAVFVGVGAILGQVRDGDNAIVNFFGKLFDRH